MRIVDRRRDDFLRAREGEEENEHGDDAVKRHRDEIPLRLIPCAKEIDERCRNGHDDGCTDHGADHAGRHENVAFMDVRGQPRDNGIEWDIHDGVRRAEQAVSDIRPYQLACRIKIWDVERQERKDCKGDGANQEIRTPLPPAGMGMIDDDAHHRIRHGIDEFRHQHHRASGCRCNAEYVGVEYHQIRGHRTEHQITAQVAHAVSDANPPLTHHDLNLPYQSKAAMAAFSTDNPAR